MMPVTVDERFELMQLVFRLAGRGDSKDTKYQKELSRRFKKHRKHPAVVMVAGLFGEIA